MDHGTIGLVKHAMRWEPVCTTESASKTGNNRLFLMTTHFEIIESYGSEIENQSEVQSLILLEA